MNSRLQNISLLLARLVTGLYFINFGLSTLWTPHWTPTLLTVGAHTFTDFYHAVALSPLLPALGFLLEIGSLIVGAALILGLFVRIASFIGMIFTLFFYFPTLAFPHVCVASTCGTYLVNEYLLVASALLLLLAFRAGEVFSVSRFFHFSQY
jgi:uncharacterized membrane protein YphA (DoxX/SURF4 family)